MKTVKLLFIAFLCLAAISVQAQEKFNIVSKAGHLVLSGTSNTSDWVLKSQDLEGDAQLVVKNDELTNIARVIINIDTESILNDNNKRMSRKAQRVLKADENPQVTFFAYGFSQMANGPRKIKGNISIAGKNADILFDFTSRVDDGVVWIVAEADAKFSDFGLEPPKDFGGAIQCNDEMKIQVQLPFALPDSNGN